LGSTLVQQAIADQAEIEIVNAHGAVIRSANAAKQRRVTCSPKIIDVNELRRVLANDPDQLRVTGVIVTGCLSGCEKGHRSYEPPEQCNAQHARKGLWN